MTDISKLGRHCIIINMVRYTPNDGTPQNTKFIVIVNTPCVKHRTNDVIIITCYPKMLPKKYSYFMRCLKEKVIFLNHKINLFYITLVNKNVADTSRYNYIVFVEF